MSDDPVDWLYGLQSHGIKLGLDGIRALLALLDRPERAFPTILVGGTNGKGSVAAMLDALLRAHGRRTGLTTSPHLVGPEERIRIDGRDVTSGELARLLDRVRTTCRRGLADGSLSAHPSFFEVITAAALAGFQEAGVDVAVLEVGLGGRLDATNATEPVVSVIVTVDLDHVATLGPTLAAIAGEKAAIARAGCPLVSGVSHEEALAVIRRRCDEIGARFVAAPPLSSGLEPPLPGEHQRHNAAVAVAALSEASRALGFSRRDDAVRSGLAATRWPGRLQLVAGAPSLLLDGAHNPAGSEALARHLASSGGARPVLVFAAMQDKDVPGLIGPLLPHVATVVATAPAVARALPPVELAARIVAAGGRAEAAATSREALERARALAGPEGRVVVAGSLYLVGEVLAIVEGREARGPVAM
ncbi:MAG TPA: folylpolyglutamate synthase/dihydrofolate synthase family protein [Candidatus Bathyarchaeia archaeon]|nr:folylpolyglutamate synthase/dihydrofolate synthase family protein [Candidatus Bathyarchaeia archaeon]